jgi:hypothetical protein
MKIIESELLEVAGEAQRRFAAKVDARGAGLREWLRAGGTYYVLRFDREHFVAEALDDSWSDANGSDMARYFWAARDSILPRSLVNYDARSIGWASIAIYYAGLYLCLAMLRGFGYGLIYLAPEDCEFLDVACPSSSSKTATPNAGTYSVAFTHGADGRVTIELTKKNVRGFHEGLWRHVDYCLDLIGRNIAEGTGVARALPQESRWTASLSTERLRAWLGESGKTGREIGWMSTLRNDINYRLARDAWSPNYRTKGVRVDRLRQDILSIIRGKSDHIGKGLQLDSDLRVMIERISVLYRDLSKLAHFPGPL